MIKIMKLVVLAAIALTFLWGVLKLFKQSRKMTKSDFKAALRKAIAFRLPAFLLALVLSGIFSILGFLDAQQSASAVISLNYAEASLGQNANSTRYNMSEIICDEVLESAIQAGALEDVSVKDLQSCLTVYAPVQGNSYDKNNYHISTEFELQYTSGNKTRKYDAEMVVQLVANAYKSYYFNKYVGNFDFNAEEVRSKINDMDYKDAVDYLTMKNDEIGNYLESMRRKNSTFSSSAGDTFGSLSDKVAQVSYVQISQNLRPYILQNGISKDMDQYQISLNYINLMLGFDRDEASTSYTITNNAVLKYAEEMTRIVLVPTWDQDGKYYMGRTKVGIDELSIQAMEFSDAHMALCEQIEENNLILQKMQVEGANSEEVRKNADVMIDNVLNDMNILAEATRKIGQEYYASQMNQCIAITVHGASIFGQIKPAVMILVVAFVALTTLATAKNIAGKPEKKKGGAQDDVR